MKNYAKQYTTLLNDMQRDLASIGDAKLCELVVKLDRAFGCFDSVARHQMSEFNLRFEDSPASHIVDITSDGWFKTTDDYFMTGASGQLVSIKTSQYATKLRAMSYELAQTIVKLDPVIVGKIFHDIFGCE